jgi:L-fuculose-phosphate aldolase
MALSEQELRQQLVDVGRLMYQKGWVAANDGNLSVRLEDERLLVTPTRISKGLMTPDDLIICDADGNKLEGRGERTTEIAMHTVIYAMRPDIHAVVHAHPPVSTGFAVCGRPLNRAIVPEIIVQLGCVPVAEYGRPGTPALSDSLKPYIPKYDALLMANHGAVTYADELYKAYYRMETMEHLARIALVAEILGDPKLLSRREVEALFEARARYGVQTRSAPEPGNPVVAEDLEERREKMEVTREELFAMVDEALRARLG